MVFPGFKEIDRLEPRLVSLLSQLDAQKMPRHVAVIMDGNGRWAKSRGKPRLEGHRQGVKTAREITETAVRLGLSALTLYSFSSENWRRPKEEVDALMAIFSRQLSRQRALLMDNGLRFRVIGDLGRLDPKLVDRIEKLSDETAGHSGMMVQLAINYGARDEIVRAVKRMADAGMDWQTLDETRFSDFLDTRGLPDPDLLIRTSGEYRLSNYLLYQLAYAEFYFTPLFWPDFKTEAFITALLDYQQRSRRFGAL
jgi:undecaprenyl diphosphate synthase